MYVNLPANEFPNQSRFDFPQLRPSRKYVVIILKNQYQFPMSKHNWLKFAGLLNDCIYQLDHKNCPFNRYRSMDQYQRMDFLLSISDGHANKLMNHCLHQQEECTPVIYQKQASNWQVAAAI